MDADGGVDRSRVLCGQVDRVAAACRIVTDDHHPRDSRITRAPDALGDVVHAMMIEVTVGIDEHGDLRCFAYSTRKALTPPLRVQCASAYTPLPILGEGR